MEAHESSISFIYNKKFLKDLKSTAAAAVLLSEEYKEHCHKDFILVSNPHESYAKVNSIIFRKFKKKILKENHVDSFSKSDVQDWNNVFIGKNVTN